MSQLGSADSGSSQASLKPCRTIGAKRLLGRAAVGAALMASCLHAGAASALSFNFSFSGTGTPSTPATVTGRVDGLVDNLNDQGSGLTVIISSATNTPVGGWPTFTNYQYGGGFDVSGGQVTGVNAQFINGSAVFYLGNQGNFSTLLQDNQVTNADGRSSSNSLVFTPVETPAPLPIFGAGAAFGWSRRLRRRIKSPA
jgi:hypothetical protein